MRRWADTPMAGPAGEPRDRSRVPRDWRLVARTGIWYGWRVLILTALFALLAGIVFPATRTTIPEESLQQSMDCPVVPCVPETPASVVADTLVRLPFYGYLLALALCVPGLVIGIGDLRSGRMEGARRFIVPFLGTALVLICIDVVPRVINPCLILGPTMDGLCREFSGRWDVRPQWHYLHHALIGAVPSALLFGWFSGWIGRRQSIYGRSGA